MGDVGKITVVCPKCSRRKGIERIDDDPSAAVEVHIQCPDCNPGDFDTPRYFDRDGNELLANSIFAELAEQEARSAEGTTGTQE